MKSTLTATENQKTRVFQKGATYGIGVDIEPEIAEEFIRGAAAEVLPTLTLRVKCAWWPGGIGTVIPPSRCPKFKNLNGVEVEPGGTLVEPSRQYCRGELVLYIHLIPLKAPADYVDHLIRNSLDFGWIEVLGPGRLMRDPATLPLCPLPEPKKLNPGNPDDRRAWHFHHMKASHYGFNHNTNEFYQLGG